MKISSQQKRYGELTAWKTTGSVTKWDTEELIAKAFGEMAQWIRTIALHEEISVSSPTDKLFWTLWAPAFTYVPIDWK